MLLGHIMFKDYARGIFGRITCWMRSPTGLRVAMYIFRYLARIVRCQHEYNPIDHSRSSDLFALHEVHVLVQGHHIASQCMNERYDCYEIWESAGNLVVITFLKVTLSSVRI